MGYDSAFLSSGITVEAPAVEASLADDLVLVDGSPVVDYTHFSLAMSRSRRLARWVAWNIDGEAFEFADSISRDGVDFRPDPRVPASAQTLDEVYASNSLGRGHLARRSDLLWGTRAEAEQANEDSFFFTNIAPQRDTFNQSGAAGVWGELEDALLASAKAERQRVSVQAGPVLAEGDLAYRGVLVPASFWKVIVYATDAVLQVRAFLLTQDLDDLERILPDAFDDFSVYQVGLGDLGDRTGLVFDAALVDAQVESVPSVALPPRRLRSVGDVRW